MTMEFRQSTFEGFAGDDVDGCAVWVGCGFAGFGVANLCCRTLCSQRVNKPFIVDIFGC